MKKIVSLVLALVLVTGMSTVSMAAKKDLSEEIKTNDYCCYL